MYHPIFPGVVTYKRICLLGVANDHHSLGGHVWIYVWGTLRVITARELVVLSGSFTSHFQVSETAPPFTWSCEPREIHSLQCWGARNKFPHAYPARTEDWTRGRRVTGAHATTCALATLRFVDGMFLWRTPCSTHHFQASAERLAVACRTQRHVCKAHKAFLLNWSPWILRCFCMNLTLVTVKSEYTPGRAYMHGAGRSWPCCGF